MYIFCYLILICNSVGYKGFFDCFIFVINYIESIVIFFLCQWFFFSIENIFYFFFYRFGDQRVKIKEGFVLFGKIFYESIDMEKEIKVDVGIFSVIEVMGYDGYLEIK